MTEKALSVFATTIIVMARIMLEPFMILRGRDAENPGLQLRDKNFITRDIVLNDEGTVRYFRRKIDLMAYAFAKSGLEKSRIFYNSLSTPLFPYKWTETFRKERRSVMAGAAHLHQL